MLTEVKDIINNRTRHQAWRNAKCQNFFMAGKKSVPEDDSANVAVCDYRHTRQLARHTWLWRFRLKTLTTYPTEN